MKDRCSKLQQDCWLCVVTWFRQSDGQKNSQQSDIPRLKLRLLYQESENNNCFQRIILFFFCSGITIINNSNFI